MTVRELREKLKNVSGDTKIFISMSDKNNALINDEFDITIHTQQNDDDFDTMVHIKSIDCITVPIEWGG